MSSRAAGGDTEVQPCIASGSRHGLATRLAPRPPLQLLLCQPYSDPAGHRGYGPSRDGCRDGAITAERLAPPGSASREPSGHVALGARLFLIARAAALG